MPVTSKDDLTALAPAAPWAAPAATGPLDAVITLPGSKSLTARALLLAALADAPTTLSGVLHSRDTAHMREALTILGAHVTEADGDPSRLHVTPAPLPLPVDTGPDGAGHIDCGLAGTVMRFIPPLVLLADAPVVLDGDEGARLRPLGPLMEALAELGVGVSWLGEPGFLPVRLAPPADRTEGSADDPSPTTVSLDASPSSQFLSALLLTGSLLPGGLAVTPSGPVPSLPHIAMTVACLGERGIAVDEPSPADGDGQRTWRVHPGRPRGGQVTIEPDLSNAGPFLAAALIAGGRVTVPAWPAATTQAGDAWRELLPRLGGVVTTEPDAVGTLRLTCRGTGRLNGIEADLSAVGELSPTVAALAVLASAQGHASRLTGIAHLRGHETDRLAALVTEARRLGAQARERADGIEIDALPDGAHLTPALLHAYADHRMATFAALIGLALPGTRIDDVACTAKTLPDFPALWEATLAQGQGLEHGRGR